MHQDAVAFAAVDLGASSGRVMRAEVTAGAVHMREVHRFPNRPVRVSGTLYWDILAVWSGIMDGLRAAGRPGPLHGVGVDSWGVDYGLLDAGGTLLGNPVHYRDNRTNGVPARVAELVPDAELFATTGTRPLPFNTVYQLLTAGDEDAMWAAHRALLIPDLLGYWLTGRQVSETTNASTTGLLDVRSRQWSTALMDRLGLRTELFPPVVAPGTLLGALQPDVAEECGLHDVTVYNVGSHDTASAVLGVPATSPNFAFISCGTWSIVGVELDEPVLTEPARCANFSNELGVDGTVRFVRNVMGLWILQESLRVWERGGAPVDLADLLDGAAQVPAGRSVIDPDRPVFLEPGDMPARIDAECSRTGQPQPRSPVETVRCILDSLAAAYGRAVRDAELLTGRRVDVVHLVGGGSRNTLLCRLTADACHRPVVAGPVEAAALGNVLVQARAAGIVTGDRGALRALADPDDTVTYDAG